MFTHIFVVNKHDSAKPYFIKEENHDRSGKTIRTA